MYHMFETMGIMQIIRTSSLDLAYLIKHNNSLVFCSIPKAPSSFNYVWLHLTFSLGFFVIAIYSILALNILTYMTYIKHHACCKRNFKPHVALVYIFKPAYLFAACKCGHHKNLQMSCTLFSLSKKSNKKDT